MTFVAHNSALESVVYPSWQRRYLARGGDTKVVVGLGWIPGLTTEAEEVRGSATLDLVGGSVSAYVEGLGGRPAELWLVDDIDGPGMSSLPEAGDRMQLVGRFVAQGEGASVSADLGPRFFRDFELDTVIVAPAGATPAQRRMAVGTRSFFERVYTKSRLAAERSRPRGATAFLSSLLRPPEAEADSTQILIAHGLVSRAVGDGGDLFFRQTFSGNGRTCGTCHPVANNLVVDADFIATLPSTDPIFIAEKPKNKGGVPGLERPALMRGFGLILENVDGFQNPTVKFVMRGVPHSLSMRTSIRAPADGRRPVERTGWSGDGAPDDPDPNQAGRLRLFPNGAIVQHFTKRLDRVQGVDFRLATATELDNMEAYMRATGRLNELTLAGVVLNDPGAELGRRIFNNNNGDPGIGSGKCFLCHLNAGANFFLDGTNFNFDAGVETVPHLARSVENFPFDGGFVTANRDCDFNGVNDCFGDGTFNTPPLIEAADTAPFFHNNVADEIEDAVAFYSTPFFNNSPSGAATGGISLTQQENLNVAASLRVINASFNEDMAIQRNQAAFTLENSSDSACGGGGGGVTESAFAETAPATGGQTCLDGATGGDTTGKRQTVDRLLQLSNDESTDAIQVLTARNLHADVVALLQSANNKNNQAIASNQSQQRKDLINSALSDLNAAKPRFGNGLALTLGDGNLLF
jgi:cytochrome c peroxidase